MIKSKVVPNEANSIDFPKLMREAGGVVVLFSRQHSGVVVLDGKGNYGVGHFSGTWTMSAFSDYDNAITLENSNE